MRSNLYKVKLIIKLEKIDLVSYYIISTIKASFFHFLYTCYSMLNKQVEDYYQLEDLINKVKQ